MRVTKKMTAAIDRDVRLMIITLSGGLDVTEHQVVGRFGHRGLLVLDGSETRPRTDFFMSGSKTRRHTDHLQVGD